MHVIQSKYVQRFELGEVYWQKNITIRKKCVLKKISMKISFLRYENNGLKFKNKIENIHKSLYIGMVGDAGNLFS